jgi:hypothetical protein
VGGRRIALVDTATPGVETPLLHTLAVNESLLKIAANDSLSTVAYITNNTSADTYDLYYATTQPAVTTGVFVETIPFDYAGDGPDISAVRYSGDEVLVATQRAIGGVATEELRQIYLTAFGSHTVISTEEAAGRHLYGYADTFHSFAFTSNPGVSILESGQPASSAVRLFDQSTAFYEFSSDSQLLVAITATGNVPSHLFLVNRGGGTPPLQITGLTNASSHTSFVRIVPAN